MMVCQQCQAIEEVFDDKNATKELDDYQRNGPGQSTKLLLELIHSHNNHATTLLDIGGGVGAIQHALLDAGVEHVTGVDASAAYIATAREENIRRGYDGRFDYKHADFVEAAPEVDAADIVTLDRVLCCYPDLDSLVSLSAARARRHYGIVYPRDTWWLRLGAAVVRPIVRLFLTNGFNFYIHSTERINALTEAQGLRLIAQSHTFFWQVNLYGRLPA